jgi:hypothetical protein
MHDDRVSTPDILGILEGSRLEEVLGSIESVEDGARKGDTLMRVFETRQQEFISQVAPILLGGARDVSPLPYADAVSADPLIDDDLAFEQMVLDSLGAHLRPGKIPDTWRMDVPRHLQGSGVAPRYDCATSRRSVAARYPADQVEFIHRLHPLAQAIAEHAWHELTLEPVRNQLAARMAVRRHPIAKQPVALFTFLERQSHPKGALFSIPVTAAGEVLDQRFARALLQDAGGAPVGEVPWSDCERVFAREFTALQTRATKAARRHVREVLDRELVRRTELARMLREEAELYRADRLAEIDEQEQAERAGAHEQTVLFREAATNWQARRAAVETHYRRRLEEIHRFASVPEPADPQALGILLVFPQV